MSAHRPVAARRTQLIDAAIAVARAEGMAAVTVRRVAEEAGVAPGVVHYCFADKKALVLAMAEGLAAQNTLYGLLSEVAPLSHADDRPELAAILRVGIDALWEALCATPEDQLVSYELITYGLRDPDALPAAWAQYEHYQVAGERLLAVVAEACGITWQRPVASIVGDVLAMMDGIVLRWLVDRDDAGAAARLGQLRNCLVAAAGQPEHVGGQRADGAPNE